MLEYDIFGARMRTVQGDKIAAAGICLKTELDECESRLALLKELSFDTADPTEIDVILAEKLMDLYRGRAVVLGTTIYIERLSAQVFRTGGVLGRPMQEIADADDTLEMICDDAWMYTISGGPGWVGFFPRSKAERLARNTSVQSIPYPAKVNEIYRTLMRMSPQGYLLISDGTGYDSFGMCAAKLNEKEMCFIV